PSRQQAPGAEGLTCCGVDERGIDERGERPPPDAVVVVVPGSRSRLQREPGLAASTRASQRHQPDLRSPQQRGDVIHLLLAAEKRRRRNRKIRLVERLQWRGISGPKR